MHDREALMSGRPLTTIAFADGRSPAASAHWDPDGSPPPSPGRRPGSALPFDFWHGTGPIVYRAGAGLSPHCRCRGVREH